MCKSFELNNDIYNIIVQLASFFPEKNTLWSSKVDSLLYIVCNPLQKVVLSLLLFGQDESDFISCLLLKVGGLGDVVTGLSKALQQKGHLVEIVLPKYDCMQYEHVQDLRASSLF